MEFDRQLRDRLLDLAKPLVEADGLEIWGLEIVPGPTTRVCVYVADAGGNATIDQCESISRQLGLVLEVEDCFPGHYVLEVSSPGLTRKFFSLEQLRPYVGDVLDARLRWPLPGTNRKMWRGRLMAVGADFVELEPCFVSDDGVVRPEGVAPVRLPWADIAFCRRVHIFPVPQKPGKKKAPRAR